MGEGRGRAGVLALSVAVLALSVGLVLLADSKPLDTWFELPWLALIPVYLLSALLALEFTRKDESIGVDLVQLPLIAGALFVDPLAHLAARLIASLLHAAITRSDPLKATVNLALAGIELAVVVTAVSFVADTGEPGPTLWLALLLGVLLGEATTSLGMSAVFLIIGRTVTRKEVAQRVVGGLVASAIFTGLSILTVAASSVDPWTLVLVAALFASLAYAYRYLNRLTTQQQATEDLYDFVKDLGPLAFTGPDTVAALDRVRELVHCRHLELAMTEGPDAGRRITVDVSSGAALDAAAPFAQSATALMQSESMTAPVVAGGTVLGLLKAERRLGTERGFDMQDLRLLETVAAELATALERGRLLGDLETAAKLDPLTGLPNLRETAGELDLLLLQSDVLICVVAVDSFREVNDTLGHVVGDDLLTEVAARLRRAAPEALLGRIGGGRFAVAVPAESAGDNAAMFGLGLRSQAEGSIQLGAIGTHVRLSVGCARGPEHGSDAETLLRRAETAMHSARDAHGGPVLWEPAYEVQGQRRLAVVMALRDALASGAVGVAYQPKLSASGRITGVEALARWTHPALGSIFPDEFVPLAEASGLMGALTSSVMRQALTACSGWQRRGGPVGVAVNVSADTVLDPAFVTEVAAVLQATGVDPGLLTLELTEDVVVGDPDLAATRMNELRSIGVRLSVDDFGTGYSSLTYLKGLPIDEVKIDRGFVASVVEDAGDQAIVRAVVDIAHTLGILVVAEGVEQEDQRQILVRLGVDELQGYLIARPMPALSMASWVRRLEQPVT